MSDIFNWQLKPAPGFPGYQPSQQQSQAGTRGVDSDTIPYHRHIPITDPVTGKPTGDNVTDQGQYGSPIVRAYSPNYSNEPYIPPHNRPHTDWATDDWAMQGANGHPGVAPGPFMPQPREFASLLHGITMGMGRWGSHYSGMPAIAMGTYASAYWKAYQSGMKERAGEAWQQYRQAHQMFLDRQKEELEAAKEGFALYSKDPNKLHQYMMGLVSKYHDDNLANALSQGPAAVDELMKYRDRNWRTAAQINAQQEKERQEAEERRLRIELMKKNLAGKGDDAIPPEWRDTPGGDGTSGAGTPEPDTAPPDTAPPDTAPPDEGGPSAPSRPDEGGPSAPSRPAGPEPTTTGQAPSAPARTPPSPATEINPLVKAAADDEVRGVKAPEGIPKAVLPKIAAEAERQKAALNDLMNKGGITGDDEAKDLAAIRKINPNLARDVEAMGHYKRVIPSGGERMYANMENLVRSVYKHWDPSTYKFIDEYQNPNSKSQQTLQRIGTLRGAAEGVLRGLKDIDENAKPPANWIDAATGRITGSGKWPYLGQAVYDYIVESLTVQNGGTRPLASQIKAEMDNFAITRGAKSIRALMSATALATVHRVDEATLLWEQRTHLKDPPPGYDEKAVGWLRTIADLDYNTGYPSDKRIPVPDDLKPYLGPAGSNLHKGAGAGGAHTPEEISGAKAWLADPKNANDPRRARIEEMIKGQ